MSTHKRGFTYSKKYGAMKYVPSKKYRRSTRRTQAVIMTKPKYSGISLFQDRPTIEWKNLDTQVTDAAYAAASSAFAGLGILNLIAQGSGNGQRVGRKCTMRSLFYRFQAISLAGANPSQDRIRIVIVFDRQFNGTLPAVADIFAPSTDYIGFQNLNNSERFLVVSDKHFECQAGGAGTVTTGECYVKMSLEEMFKGTGATALDIATGALIGYIAAPGSATGFTYNFASRVRFTDV